MARISYSDLARKGIVLAGYRKIVKFGNDRYLVYLPRSLNYLWRELNEKHTKVQVFIDIASSDGYEDS